MIIIDVETTGIEPTKHSLLSIGAVDFSNPSNQFHEECRIWDGAHVMDEALAINGFTEEQIRDPKKQTDIELVKSFLKWTESVEERTFGGLNHHLDLYFIHMTAMRNHLDFNWPKRIVDLHSVAYFHMLKRGLTPPIKNHHSDMGGDKIMPYVGMPLEPKPHIAINGAKWEAEAFSRLVNDKALFPEFEQYKIPWLNN